jgi:hypothetical protein
MFFQGKSALQKRFSFFESSFAEKPPSEEAGGPPFVFWIWVLYKNVEMLQGCDVDCTN